jgi:hypothetical protein
MGLCGGWMVGKLVGRVGSGSGKSKVCCVVESE